MGSKEETAIVFLLMVACCSAVQLASVITPDDGKRFGGILQGTYSDLDAAYYSILAMKSYTQGGAIGSAEAKSACAMVKSCDTKSLNSLAKAAATLNEIKSSCEFTFPAEAIELATSKLDESNMKTLYAAVSFLTAIGQKVENEQILATLLDALKADNSVLSSSLALLAASKLDKPDLSSFLKTVDIEDMAAQADEIDSKYLYFENDLEVTSTFVSAIIAVSEASSAGVAISPEQVVLFSNFLLRTKSSVTSRKDVFLILYPLGKIAASSKIALAKADLVSGTAVSEERPLVRMHVTNVLSQPLAQVTVKADSVVRASDNEVILSNAPFKFDGVDAYQLTVWQDKPKSGFYDVTLQIASDQAGRELVGVSGIEFRVKVTTKIALKNIELGASEKDQHSASLQRIAYPNKAADLKADSQQKIVMKFEVEDLTDGSIITPHQAFVRFVCHKTEQEVIFVAEPDAASVFKFEVDLSSAGREQFNSASGVYSMSLIVGDAAVANPIFWHFGDVRLKLGGEAEKKESAVDAQYARKPDIGHVFRTPEPRPPAIVSQAFTVACLLPLALLLVAWKGIGANLSEMKLAPKNLIFHAGLAGIFALYYMCWLRLDMFTTVQYLVGVGAVTFVFGNSVLSEMANSRAATAL